MASFEIPAYPQPIAFHPESASPTTSWAVHSDFSGFTKLELASLMIARGFLSADKEGNWKPEWLATQSVEYAKAILEEANK